MSEGEPTGKQRRKLRNFLISPKTQATTGVMIFAIGFLCISALFVTILLRFNEMLDTFVAMAVDKEIAADASEHTKMTLWMTYGVLIVGFLGTAMFLAVTITHRYLGPMVAIRRQIKALREGNFKERVNLRQADQFRDVADDLNALAEEWEKKSS